MHRGTTFNPKQKLDPARVLYVALCAGTVRVAKHCFLFVIFRDVRYSGPSVAP